MRSCPTKCFDCAWRSRLVAEKYCVLPYIGICPGGGVIQYVTYGGMPWYPVVRMCSGFRLLQTGRAGLGSVKEERGSVEVV